MTIERMIEEEQESVITPLALNFDIDEQAGNTPNLEQAQRTSWSKIETQSFRRLLREGRSYSEISQRLGKTIQQVRDKKKTEIRGRRI